ncbi:hypothetical protein [Synechococcus sp. MIT S9451]|jgi:hypothetical protein|uniref:hypothetical protein n=1 Tax=Synechococcus sp. MIT S9451 TaxID=3082543 RepID=UPI0039B45C8A
MTNSFLSETIDQEISIEEMAQLNGGNYVRKAWDWLKDQITGGKSAKDLIEKGIICQSGSSHQHGNHPDANCPDNSTQVKEGGCTDDLPF